MVVIDRGKCIGCGLCAADCPAEKLTVTDGKAVYTPGCIQCGHCESRCPFHVKQGARMQEISRYFGE